MRFPSRCRKCHARKTFPKHPDKYKIKRICACGGTYCVDSYRMSKNVKDRGESCVCTGLIIKHRKGQKHCVYHKSNIHNMVDDNSVIPESWLDAFYEGYEI